MTLPSQPTGTDDLEQALQHARDAAPWHSLDLRRWQRALLDMATEDEAFRVQLLRFVDVLPTLRSAAAVAEHVSSYFGDTGPDLMRRGARLAGNHTLQPLLARLVDAAVHSMAGRFIAGADASAAFDRLRQTTAHGMAFTVDLLGEATLAPAEADAYAAGYHGLLRLLAEQHPPAHRDARWSGVPAVNISLKLSALTPHFEPAADTGALRDLTGRLGTLLTVARGLGAYVHVDMEQHRFKDLTHRVFRETLLDPRFRDWPDIGIVVQAYLRDAEADLEMLRDLARERGTPFTVRLVKGAYWDEEVIVARQNGWPAPVYEQKPDTDASYERCTSLLLDAWPHLRPAFGTHNPASIAQAVRKAEGRGRSASEFELQMLYGLAPELAEAVAQRGYRLRLYTPVGAIVPGMAYLVRRLLENTSNESWFRGTTLATPPAPPAAASPVVPVGFRNAAPARWHEPAVRDAMTAALNAFRQGAGAVRPLLVAGTEVWDRPLSAVHSPADPAFRLGEVAQATADDVERAVDAAQRALAHWRDRPAGERAGICRRAAGLLEARRFAFAATMVFECAKPWREADGDVTEAIDYLRFYAGQAEELLRPVTLGQSPGETNAYLREARGITAVIAPWNFPLAILTGMTVAALVTGNAALVKPAGLSPLVAHDLVRLLHEAGVPEPVVQYLPGDGGTVGRLLVEHPLVSTIAFTGSNAVGLDIIARAAQARPGQRGIKRVIAELGGKNAIIIDEDADLDLAVADTLASAFGYAGQKCSACSRLVVVGSAYREVTDRLRAAVPGLVVGPPDQPQTVVPPVISAAARDRIAEYAALGDAAGRLLVRGQQPDGPGYYIAPSVYTDVPLDSRLAREEVFGPLLCVFHAADFDQALAIAADSDYGLTGGLFSRHPGHIARARLEFSVGNLYINRRVTGAVVGRQAFGGMAMSGEGEKTGGPDYLRQFTVARTITENTMRRGYASHL